MGLAALVVLLVGTLLVFALTSDGGDERAGCADAAEWWQMAESTEEVDGLADAIEQESVTFDAFNRIRTEAPPEIQEAVRTLYQIPADSNDPDDRAKADKAKKKFEKWLFYECKVAGEPPD